MALTDTERDALRFHMGYGNISPEAAPYTPDGFYEVFNDIIGPNLSTAIETTSTSSVVVPATGGDATVTPASMTGIVAGGALVVDVAEQAEIVVARSVSATTFTAFFLKRHPGTGYPIGTLAGVTRLRMLLWQAERSWARMINADIADSAGLKSIDKGDVVWFEGFRVLKDRLDQYLNIVCSMSSLVQVQHKRACGGRGPSLLETY